jgi:fructose-1,6-bisphosphatase/inositol monophosphatase family enzyme
MVPRANVGGRPYDRAMPKTSEMFQAELEVAIDAARQAGAIQRDRYERLERIVHKSEKDVVTEVDHLCEEAVLSTIKARFPDDHSLAEERGASHPGAADAATQAQPVRRTRSRANGSNLSNGSAVVDPDQPATPPASPEPPERLWIVDPLDGTINYANGIPFFCVVIGLVVQGRPVVGVVYDPLRDEMFSGVADRGAWLDGQPIAHPVKERLIDCVVSISLPGRGWSERERRVRKAIRVARNLGSAALQLTYVANGRFDAMFQAGGLSLWDVAGPGVIVEASGARVTAPDGGDWFDLKRNSKSVGVLAASPAHHVTLSEMLRADRPSPAVTTAGRV